MVFETLSVDYSTTPSIIYIACCKIVLMFYNERVKSSVSDSKS